jgi:hypothetical protein
MAATVDTVALVPHQPAAGATPPYANLLHELTYALSGITGDLFVDTGAPRPKGGVRAPKVSCFRVTAEARWLSAADRQQMNELLFTAFHYHEIDRFVQQHQDLVGEERRWPGWHGLCAGLEGAVPSPPPPSC